MPVFFQTRLQLCQLQKLVHTFRNATFDVKSNLKKYTEIVSQSTLITSLWSAFLMKSLDYLDSGFCRVKFPSPAVI